MSNERQPFWEEEKAGIKKISVRVKVDGEDPEAFLIITVEEFADIEAAVQHFTVLDSAGNVITDGEEHILRFINSRHRRNRMNGARKKALQKAGRAPRRRSKVGREDEERLKAFLNEIGLSEIRAIVEGNQDAPNEAGRDQ